MAARCACHGAIARGVHLRLKADVGSVDHVTSVAPPANNQALSPDGIEARMDAIRLKQMLGGALTERELMCLQIEQNGFGCRSCASPTRLLDPGAGPAAPGDSRSA